MAAKAVRSRVRYARERQAGAIAIDARLSRDVIHASSMAAPAWFAACDLPVLGASVGQLAISRNLPQSNSVLATDADSLERASVFPPLLAQHQSESLRTMHPQQLSKW